MKKYELGSYFATYNNIFSNGNGNQKNSVARTFPGSCGPAGICQVPEGPTNIWQ